MKLLTYHSLRLLVGLVLLATAVGKLLDLHGFGEIVVQYQVIPAPLAFWAGAFVTASELILAVWLFSNRLLIWAALCATLMHLGYAAWAAFALMRGLEIPNCGCFGVFLARPLSGSTVIEDLTLAALCLLLYGIARASNLRRNG